MKKKTLWTIVSLAAALAAASAYFALSRGAAESRFDSAAPAGGAPTQSSTDNRF